MNAPAGQARGRVRPRIGTTGLALAVAVLLADSFTLSRIAGWIPRSVLVITLLLLFIQFGIEMREMRQLPLVRPDTVTPAQAGAVTPLAAMGWLAGALGSVMLLGTAVGSALFAYAYLRRGAAESRTTCAVFALALGAALQLVFGVLLQATLFRGWLWQLLAAAGV